MKKMYAALLAAALLTAGAGLNVQAAYVTGSGFQLENGYDKFHVSSTGEMVNTGISTGYVNGTSGNFSGMISAGGNINSEGVIIADKGLSVGDGAFYVHSNGYTTVSGLSAGTLIVGDGVNVADAIAANAEKNTEQDAIIAQETEDRKAADEKLSQKNEEQDKAIQANKDNISAQGEKLAAQDTKLTQQGQQINALSDRVSDLGGEIDNVGAISAALAGLHPLDYDGTGSKFQLAAAMGNYDGTQAAAIGGFYHFNEDVMMSVGGATSFGGDNKSAFNVGVSFRVGQGSSGTKVNSDDVLAQLEAMNEKIAALEAENQSLSEKVAALEAPAPAAE